MRVTMRNGKNFQSREGEKIRILKTISSLPGWAWGMAGLLAIVPAAGFHIIINALAPHPEPFFLFFYWLAALYAIMRKTDTGRGILNKTGLIVALELVVILVVKWGV